jgi:hypothetical protein
VNRYRPAPPAVAHAELRAIRDIFQQRLRHAQDLGRIPGRHPHLLTRSKQVRYELTITRDLRNGEIAVGCRIERWEWLARPPQTPREWLLTDGLALVAEVDQVLDRASLGVRGNTVLIPEDL